MGKKFLKNSSRACHSPALCNFQPSTINFQQFTHRPTIINFSKSTTRIERSHTGVVIEHVEIQRPKALRPCELFNQFQRTRTVPLPTMLLQKKKVGEYTEFPANLMIKRPGKNRVTNRLFITSQCKKPTEPGGFQQPRNPLLHRCIKRKALIGVISAHPFASHGNARDRHQ